MPSLHIYRSPHDCHEFQPCERNNFDRLREWLQWRRLPYVLARLRHRYCAALHGCCSAGPDFSSFATPKRCFIILTLQHIYYCFCKTIVAALPHSHIIFAARHRHQMLRKRLAARPTGRNDIQRVRAACIAFNPAARHTLGAIRHTSHNTPPEIHNQLPVLSVHELAPDAPLSLRRNVPQLHTL